MSTDTRIRVQQDINGVVTLDMHFVDCAGCGLVFGYPKEFDQRRRDDGQKFYCPSGHVNVYTESELDRQRRAARNAQKRADNAEQDRSRYQEWLRKEREAHKATERSLSATKGVVTRTKKRIGKGTCPCCNRHFANVERHMTIQHPDYAESPPPAAKPTQSEGNDTSVRS